MGEDLGRLRTLLILSWMAMLAHQFEEYGLPGGFPVVTNVLFFGESDIPDRYPFNANQTMVTNLAIWPFYIAAIMWPEAIWLALPTILAALAQPLAHAVAMPLRLRLAYNPGMLTSVFLFIPVGVAYLVHVTSNGLAGPADWIVGSLGAVAFLGLTVGLPIRLMHSCDSRYPYAPEEMHRPYTERLLARLDHPMATTESRAGAAS